MACREADTENNQADQNSSGLSSLNSERTHRSERLNLPEGDETGISNASGSRTCWICFASEEDDKKAAWLQPCKCRGTTKWVHQSCLSRWIDEKQKGDASRSVRCPQCKTPYIIILPRMSNFARALELLDNFLNRLGPYWTGGLLFGAIYWTAVSFGAGTIMQIVGFKEGLSLIESADRVMLLIALPSVPACLILCQLIPWEEGLIRFLLNPSLAVRDFPFLHLIIPTNQEERQAYQYQLNSTATLIEAPSTSQVICSALLLPTISQILGQTLFSAISNNIQRTLLGGLTYLIVTGFAKIYLRLQQLKRINNRRYVDHTEENLRLYTNRRSRNHNQECSQQRTNSGNRTLGATGIWNGESDA